jgi:O-antigen/teichoic acid export membrane protein
MLFPIAVAAGILVAYWPLGSLDTRSKILVVVLVGMSPLINTFGRACYQMLMVERDLNSLRIATLIVNAVGFVVIITAVIFGALDVWVAALALALGRFAEHGYAWWRAKVKVQGRAKLKPMLAFGVKAIPGSLTDLANNRLDQLFIIPFLGFKALGFYAVAVTVNFIPFQIGTALSSSTYGQVRVEAQRGQHGVTSQLIRRGFVTTGAAAIAVAIATPTILPLLYGQRFDPSVGPTLILLPGTIAWSLTLIATQIGNGINKPQYGSIAQIAGVVVTITGLIIMVPRYGVAGAAIVSTITYVTRLVILLTLLRKNGITGTTPRPTDITWLLKRSQRIATRPLRAARRQHQNQQPPHKTHIEPEP